MDRTAEEFLKLVETVAVLRGEGGCPWDRQQTHESLRKYLIEETYEVVEAVDRNDPAKLREELGDLLLQILLHAQLADEVDEFDIAEVCRSIRKKLLRRHPHVFGQVQVSGVDDVLHNWEEIKAREPGYEERIESVMAGIPESLPALMRAAEVSKRAVRVGFEWPDMQGVIDKLEEEVGELKKAVSEGDKEEIKAEIGDLLFTAVNVARYNGLDAEESLREMLTRFIDRFGRIEASARESGRHVSDLTLNEMERVWNEAKREK